MKFTKMHGAGNDYIYVDTMKYDIPEPGIIAREWSRPHTGIGSDGLVLIGRSDIADFSMRIFNADGSEARMCGNASRCVGKYLYEKGLASGREIRLETLSGIKTLYPDVSEDGTVGSVCVDMGPASDIKELRIGGNSRTRASPFPWGIRITSFSRKMQKKRTLKRKDLKSSTIRHSPTG